MHVNDILLRHDLQAISERLYSHVDWAGGPLSCWNWIGSKKPKGYGEMSFGGKRYTVATHRLSYVLANGPLPQGEGYHGTCVLHHCDNPSCCNPAHLFLGSNRDNVNDMVRKNRQAKGVRTNRAKLTEESVREILSSRDRGDILAARFRVSATAISAIRQRKSWRHIVGVEVIPYKQPTGADSWSAKLTEADVRAIRASDATHAHLSRTYKVSPRCIRDIRAGRSWKALA